MSFNPPATSPYRYEALDFAGKAIRITINYDNTTKQLVDVAGVCATVFRDPACQYHKIYVGLGADGHVESTTKVFDLTALSGSANRTAAQVQALTGITSLNEINGPNTQITAGP